LDRAKKSLPFPAIRKTLLRNRRKHDNIRKKEKKREGNKIKFVEVLSYKIANSGTHLRRLKYPFHIAE
jgi:hypothetical protein